MSHNIYDNQDFFDRYMELRENEYCANNLEEKPELFEMLPDLYKKTMLDLGCGYGDDCAEYIKMGAQSVLGVDISQKMLSEARKRHKNDALEFTNIDMEHIDEVDRKFDIVVSSLAMHYVEDFESLCKKIFNILNEDGIFLFSQEHPMFTATKKGVTWLKDIDDKVVGMVLENYPDSGMRRMHWLANDDVIKYHRTVSEIINSLIKAGFVIDRLKEPKVPEDIISLSSSLSRCRHVPDYLFVLSHK